MCEELLAIETALDYITESLESLLLQIASTLLNVFDNGGVPLEHRE